MTATPRRYREARAVGAIVVLVAALAGFWTPVTARTSNHCVTPAGDDLNEVFHTRDAFIAPFCTEARAGDRWRAVIRMATAGEDFVFPDGYSPSRLPLDEDFLAKFTAGRYVVDAGTEREREYVFPATEHLLQQGGLPSGDRFVRWVTPSLPPLSPGEHTLDEYVTLTAEFWDGIGIDPDVNQVPAGESLVGSLQFRVANPDS